MNRRDRIESARARGLSMVATAKLVKCGPAEVSRVWREMDEINDHEDVVVPRKKPATQGESVPLRTLVREILDGQVKTGQTGSLATPQSGPDPRPVQAEQRL